MFHVEHCPNTIISALPRGVVNRNVNRLTSTCPLGPDYRRIGAQLSPSAALAGNFTASAVAVNMFTGTVFLAWKLSYTCAWMMAFARRF